MVSITTTYKDKWEFNDNPHYIVTECKKVINLKRGKIVKKTIKDGCKGWWIAKEFIKESQVNDKVRLIFKIKVPF